MAISRGDSEEGDELINLAMRYLKQNNGVGNTYTATWMLIAQWDKVHPQPHGESSEEDILLNPFLNKVNCVITFITFEMCTIKRFYRSFKCTVLEDSFVIIKS